MRRPTLRLSFALGSTISTISMSSGRALQTRCQVSWRNWTPHRGLSSTRFENRPNSHRADTDRSQEFQRETFDEVGDGRSEPRPGSFCPGVVLPSGSKLTLESRMGFPLDLPNVVVGFQAAISRFVAEANDDPKPFTWIADPNKSIVVVRRGYQVLDSIH